jgi:stringent starvation protein B
MGAHCCQKQMRMLASLKKGMVMLHLDARRPAVVVPKDLHSEAHLRLNFSYRFDPADLVVDDVGVRATLSFHGVRFLVAVPWSAVFAISSHVTREFWAYPEDMPAELFAERGSTLRPKSRRSNAVHPPPLLRQVASRKSESEEDPKPCGPPHLRLIK